MTQTLAEFLRDDSEKWRKMTTIQKLDHLISEEKNVVMPALGGYLNGSPTQTLDALQSARNDLIALRTALAAAEEVISTIPCTVDNVLITPGMTTWCADHNPFPHTWDIRLRNGETYLQHNEPQYSTREAAEAARKGEPK